MKGHERFYGGAKIRWQRLNRFEGFLNPISQQQFADAALTRLVEQGVGLSPKRFARIVRLQSALRSLPDGISWASIARESGYADKAHFIDLVGAPPGALVKLAARTQ